MTEHPERSGRRDDATDPANPADAALARLDELLDELQREAVEAVGASDAEARAPSPPRRVRDRRSFGDRQAEARRLMQEELARRQREIEERRRAFDPQRRSRERSRAAVEVLPGLFRHALTAEPRSGREIAAVGGGLATLPFILEAALAADLRREAEAAAAERERRARTAVAALHRLFTWALPALPPPPAVVAAMALRAVFTRALAAAPSRPAAGPPPPPEPVTEPPPPEPEAEPVPEPVTEPPPPEPEAEPVPEPVTESPPPAREPEPAAPRRRRWWPVAGVGAAGLIAGGLWLSGVFASDDSGENGENGDAPVSFTLTDDAPTTSVVGQAEAPLVDVFAGPDTSEVTASLEHPTATGAPLVFLVTDDATTPDRVEVLLPVAPTGARGWVDRADLSFGVTDFRVIVRRAAHRLELWEGDELVLDVPAAIGLDAPETGESLYVKELLQPPDPDTVYGSYAFGLSGASNTLDKFTQGDGVVALHGTNDPSVIGRDVDAGSIRLTNTDIEELVGVLPLGTPVEIQ